MIGGKTFVLNRFTKTWLDGSNYPLDWNGPTRPCKTFAALDTPVFALFRATAEAHADRIAIDDGTARLTYGETLAAATALAQRLAAATAPGALVGILLPSSANFPVAMLACLAAGRMFVPLDAHYPRAWLAGVIADAGLSAVIGRFDDAADLVPAGVTRIDLAQRVAAPSANLVPVAVDAPAFVLFTSGSTGKPKGIVNSQRALLRRVQQYVEASKIDETDRFLPLSSECTIAGLRERLTALLTGATLHLIDVQRAGARAILDRLRDDAITMVYGVPALLRTLMQLGEANAPPSLRNLRIGGDAVLWSDVDALREWLPADCRIQLGYSSTEAPIMQWFVPKDFPRDGARIPLGYPLAGNALAIVGEDGAPVGAGEEGELVLRSPYLALGRWVAGRVDATDFPTDPNDPACRIQATGDLARLRADGMIDLVGRKDRQIKIRGQRVEPAELEAALRRAPGICDAAVFPRRVGQAWWLIAYVVGRIDADKLKASLRDELPAALQPQRVHAVDAIPRLASAKLDMTALSALDEGYQRREAVQEIATSAAPVGETEEKIAAIICDVLERDAVGRDDDFFDLGGDSLATLDLIFALEQEFGVELPVTVVYDAPTAASLAALMEHRGATTFSPLVKIKDGEGAPLFIVHGVGGNVMELFAPGRRIEDRPVYALQARGLDGKEVPARSVTAMAQDYLAAIRAACPNGPYHLAGYSSGGVIALEMAARLTAAGEPPASLSLIDSQTNARQWPLSVWVAFLGKRVAEHLRTFRGLPPRQALAHAGGAARALVRRLAWRLGFGAPVAIEPFARQPDALQAVFEATFAAVSDYHPPRYPGRVDLIVPEHGDSQRPDPRTIWRNRCAKLCVHQVPGNHRSMVRGENAKVLAAVLTAIARG